MPAGTEHGGVASPGPAGTVHDGGSSRPGAYGPAWSKDAGFAFRTFAWMAGFLVLTALIGYLAAVMIFVPSFLLIVARARTRTTIIYTAVLYVVLLALPSLLPIDLPEGLLGRLL
jgi:hypothetical protein